MAQVIRPSVDDNVLEPDALRGSEWVLQHVKDESGAIVEIQDFEQERRDIQRESVQSSAPTQLSSSQSTTPPRTMIPVTTQPEPEWESKARAMGWGPTESTPDRYGSEPTSATREVYNAPSGPPVDPQYRAPYTETRREETRREESTGQPPFFGAVPAPAEPPV